MGGQTFRTHTAKSGGCNPMWNETFRVLIMSENDVNVEIMVRRASSSMMRLLAHGPMWPKRLRHHLRLRSLSSFVRQCSPVVTLVTFRVSFSSSPHCGRYGPASPRSHCGRPINLPTVAFPLHLTTCRIRIWVEIISSAVPTSH